MARITLDRLGHRYAAGGAYALAPTTLTWAQGGAYALLGPSGCGKTTLLNIISGLIHPSEGRVLFDDADVTATPTEARNIAQVFQFPVVYDTMTVRQNFAFPLKNRGVPEATIRARVAEIAKLLEMEDALDRPARGLTADAKQKISLGRGLVRADVAAILFDEPLTVIDPHLKWQLRSKLKALHRAIDVTMIYVTHDQTEALTFADQVVVMNAGEVVQVGTPEDLFARPEHVFVGHFIGSPGMNFLPCTVARGVARVGGNSIALGADYGVPVGGLQLGIRPEFARLAPAGQGLPVQLGRVEDLGRVRLARCTIEGSPFVATVPDGPVPEAPTVVLPAEHLHLYADSRRVAPREPAREAA
jgi:glycerol transport system ATP-binding protein